MKIGLKGFTFDSAHYTQGTTEKCRNLHGHTFSVSVEVEGDLNEAGMVTDFATIKEVVREVLEEWDHKFLVPEREADDITGEGPFNLEIKKIERNAVTTENIALGLAKEIHKELGLPTKVKVYEGKGAYAVGKWPEGE